MIFFFQSTLRPPRSKALGSEERCEGRETGCKRRLCSKQVGDRTQDTQGPLGNEFFLRSGGHEELQGPGTAQAGQKAQERLAGLFVSSPFKWFSSPAWHLNSIIPGDSCFSFITVCVHRVQIETLAILLVSMQLRRNLHDHISTPDLKKGPIKNRVLCTVTAKGKGSPSFTTPCHNWFMAVRKHLLLQLQLPLSTFLVGFLRNSRRPCAPPRRIKLQGAGAAAH